MAISKLQ